jgi:23S rRNA pseudouridine955/2504/2580 synthase/23S rRNA pseudouridine1911/1915/1917 synthase
MKHTPQSLERRKVRSTIDWSCCGQTLLNYLVSRFPYRDSGGWRQVIESGEITVNGRLEAPEKILQLHDQVEYQPKELPEPPAEMHYKIVFEDPDLLVIDKPGNLCVHPAGPFFKHTLWHMLCSKYGEIHFVNRLDRETSGLLLAAKDPKTAKLLAKSVAAKRYKVIVHGEFPESADAEGFLLSANSIVRKKRRFVKDMPENPPFESCRTRFVRECFNGTLSLLQAELFTGRMHQIRATLFSMGFPVAGDKLYGMDERFYLKQRSGELTDADREILMIPRQALHSAELEFIHPDNREKMTFSSPLPTGLHDLLN